MPNENTDRARFDAAVAVIEAAGALPFGKLHWESRRYSYCQANEDDCTYKHCPRWRDGKIVDERHCALDYVEDDDA